MSLLVKKPLSTLAREAEDAGEHSLKRTLGPVQLTALGIGAVIGAGIFVLAGLVALASVLNFLGYREAQRSLLGMGILLAAVIVMPWLGSRKRRLAAAVSSATLRADAAESSLLSAARKRAGFLLSSRR